MEGNDRVLNEIVSIYENFGSGEINAEGNFISYEAGGSGAAYQKGLQGIVSYIGSDGSVSHCCRSCLCPGSGTKNDYKNHPWVYNDHHAFGPIVLAFAQAAKMDIELISPRVLR